MATALTSAAHRPIPDWSVRIPALDGLRGIAILLVLLRHAIFGVTSVQGIEAHSRFASFVIACGQLSWSGVDLFFVLSGFLIGGILLDARSSPRYFQTFYIRRVFRILPIYYIWTLLFAATVIVMVVFFPGRLGVTSRDLLRVPTQLLFLQNFWPGTPRFT